MGGKADEEKMEENVTERATDRQRGEKRKSRAQNRVVLLSIKELQGTKPLRKTIDYFFSWTS